MQIQIRDIDFHLTDCVTRIPFRFGINTMTRAPLLLLRATVDCDNGVTAVGLSSDLLVPKWFDKDPESSISQDWLALIDSARYAADSARSVTAAAGVSVFELWHGIEEACVRSGRERGLVDGFGVALVERAVMDAVCRAAGVSFCDALRTNLFAIEPGVVRGKLADWDVAAAFGDPLTRVRVRHTVGLVDPLRSSGLTSGERVGDGLPEALDEDIARYGLTSFKIKLCGDRPADLERLTTLAEIFAEHVTGDLHITVDGNEQYTDLMQLVELLETGAASSATRPIIDALVSIEQPLPRTLTFDEDANASLGELSNFAPVIIDEADYGLPAFEQAIDLGYRGISMKNCKGVIKSILNHGLCRIAGDDLFLSAEDLTNLPVVALQQDLASVAALGLEHVERNGHHYFRGLHHLPESEALSALAKHPDLYVEDDGCIQLRIEDGLLALDSLQRPGYGYSSDIDIDGRTPLEDWAAREN